MKKILFILFLSFIMAFAFKSNAYASMDTGDIGGNADDDYLDNTTGKQSFVDGVSEYMSGWLMYVVEEKDNGEVQVKTDVKVWYSYNEPTEKQWSSTKVLDTDTRIGDRHIDLFTDDVKTNAPWGPPVVTSSGSAYASSDGNRARGRAVKNWFTTDTHLTDTLAILWGEGFAKEFIDNEYVLVLEPVYWLQMHVYVESADKYIATGIYGYGTVRGFARIMNNPTYSSVFTSTGSRAFGRYTNYYFPNCCKFEFDQLGLKAPNRTADVNADSDRYARLYNQTMIDYAYGIMTVWAREAGTGTPEVPTDPSNPPDETITYPVAPTKVNIEAYTYNYSDEFNLDKNNDPAGRIPSGEILTNGIEVDSWRVHYAPLKKSGSGTFTASYDIEVVDTSIHEVNISAGRYNEFKDSYPNLRIENGYLYDGSTPLKEEKVTTEYHYYNGYEVPVTKSYEYLYLADGLNSVDFLDFSYAEITNDCYYKNAAGEPMVVHRDNKTFEDIEYKKGKYIISTPTNKSNILIKGCSSVEEGKSIANGRASGDVGNYVVEGDYLTVNGIQFLNGNNPKKNIDPTKYSYPKTNMEVDVKIPFNVRNGHYPTSAKYYYINRTKGLINTTTKDADKTTIEQRILKGYTQNEPVFVHTPVVSPVKLYNTETETQLVPSKVNSDYVDYQLILEHTYSFKFDMGMHLNLQGYGSNDFSKYVKKAEVSFPFDVAIVENETGTDMYTYYKANEWIEVNYREETFFYIPPYALETDYAEIYYRVWAYNSEEIESEQESANLESNNYVAYYKTAVQLSGIIYNFQVVGIQDERLTDAHMNDIYKPHEGRLSVFPYCPYKEERKWGNLNRVGTPWLRYTLDSTITNAWNPRYLLPFSNYKGKEAGQLSYPSVTMSTGTRFAFSVETIANLWDDGIDSIEITPTFRYVDKNGNVDTDILLYTSSTVLDYMPWGSEDEWTYDVELSHDGFRGSFNDAQVKYTMQKYNENNGTNYTYTSNFLYTREMKASYTASKITLNSNLRLLTGHVEELEKNLAREGAGLIQLDDDAVIPLDAETKDRFNYSMQTWFGMYTVPSNEYLHVVRKKDLAGYTDMDDDGDVDLYDYMYSQETGGIAGKGQDDIFQHDGFLVIGFDIVTKNNGEEHLTYHGGLLDMCEVQGIVDEVFASKYFSQNPEEITIQIESGDVAIVDLSKDLLDRTSKVGIMIIN